MAREHLQSEGGCNSTSLNAGNDIVGETPRHQERGFPDVCVCVVERELLQSDGGCHSTSLNAGNGVVVETPGHQEYDVRIVADT